MSKDKATKQAKPETAADAKPQAPAPQASAAEAAQTSAPATEPTNSHDAAPAQTPVATQTDEAAASAPETKGNPPPAPPAAPPPKKDDHVRRYRVLSPIRVMHGEPDVPVGEIIPGESFEHVGIDIDELLASKSIELVQPETEGA